MIQTWIANVTALYDNDIYKYYHQSIPEFRKQKADRLRFQEDRALSVGAWILLEKMKSEYGLSDQAVFNISHSGEYVLCSVEDDDMGAKKLGCDLEKVTDLRLQVAKRFYCDSEYESIMKCSNEEQTDRFYRLWVLKESFVKATRLGMKLDMRAFEIGFGKGDKPYLHRAPEMFREKYMFREYCIEGLPYRIAVCADASDFAAHIRVMELE